MSFPSPMINPTDYSISTLVPAEFLDLNAGSGPSNESSRLHAAVSGARVLQQRAMQEVQAANGDERDWLRVWRRKIRETISRYAETFNNFMIKKKDVEPEVMQKMRTLLTRLSLGAPSSNKMFLPELGWDISMNSIATQLETDVSMNILEYKEDTKKLIRTYTDTLKELFSAENRLQEKLSKITTITDRIQGIYHIENIPELEGLSLATDTYLQAVLKNNDIENDFVTFMDLYKRWLILYDAINLPRVAQVSVEGASEFPTQNCCICTTNEITHAMIPCGHTFCGTCINKQTTVCYICRTTVRDRLRIHLS